MRLSCIKFQNLIELQLSCDLIKNWILFKHFMVKDEISMDEQIKTLCENHQIKFTAARTSILEVLKEAHCPLNYEQIKEKMAVIMDKATFYRNIALFEESGIVHKFEADDRKWYFELSSKTHAHFICDQCHQITCMDVDIGQVQGEVKSIVLKGTCKECHS